MLTLLSAVPCSRVDLTPSCVDGRGGWVYSQCDPSRCYESFENSTVFLALSVFSERSDKIENIDSTKLTAVMNGEVIGSSTLQWQDNNWGVHLDDGSVYSWPQHVTINPIHNGLVEVSIEVQFDSRSAPVVVSQSAYCHVRRENRSGMNVSRLQYWIAQLCGKRRTYR